MNKINVEDFELEDNAKNISEVVKNDYGLISNCSFKLKDLIDELSVLKKQYGENAIISLDSGDNNINSYIIPQLK